MSRPPYRERLIDEVKRFPVLYDTRHENHRDMDVRERCWDEIAARLGANSEMLKREWKILRDSLRQALKKSRQGATTKAGLPVKKWRFQQRMNFLLPYMTRRPRASFDHMKVENEEEQDSQQPAEGGEEWEGEPDEVEGAGSGGRGAGAAGGLDALELFFASVCASARRLPPAAQRALKREVLDALLRAEAEAEHPSAPAQRAARAPDSSKPEAYDDEF